MKLLLNRDQTGASVFSLVPLRIGPGVVFSLKAELELDEEEAKLIRKYSLESSIIVQSNLIDDIKKAMRPALLLAAASFILLFLVGGLKIGLIFSGAIFIFMTAVYFDAQREQILVRNLLDGGRTFHCDSVVELIQKEAFLEGVAQYLRQLLVSAKHWDDRETIDIKPLDKDAAKRAVLSSL